jgi:2,4-diketo-3-deoxy-L-fuconate hydrolase
MGRERPGIMDRSGTVRDLSGVVNDIDGAAVSPDGLACLRALDLESLPMATNIERLGSCIARPGKFICVGLNFADHAAETGAAVPQEPVLFLKATSAVSGPNDCIVKPRGSTKLDWEVELAFVMGSECRYVDERSALSAIAGYCVCNDVSERAFQLERGGQWDKGKGCDSFGPIGPWLVTTEELTDTNDLDMWLEVNGKRFQSGSTRTMIFKPAFLVAYISQFMSLQPGDIVSTGTPPGVGMGQRPPVYLNIGDTVDLGIARLGAQRQVVVGPR